MISDRAMAALEAVMPPGTPIKDAGQRDRDVLVSVAGRTLRLRWLSVGWPRQVAEALRQEPRPDVVAAPRLSPGARELARREQVGWVDEAGAAEICADNLLISRTGEIAEAPNAIPGWRPATLAVCEVLLTGCPATVSAVADHTGLAVSTVAGSLKFLDREGLLGADAPRGPLSRRYLTDHDALLDAYAAASERLRPHTALRVGVQWRDPVEGAIEAGRLWQRAGIRWAVTSALSAAVLAPVLTEVSPMEIYVAGRTPGDLRRTASSAGLREMDGGRLILRPFPTPASGTVTTQLRPGLMSLLWPRVYADLRTSGVRGEDAAEHLREEMT
ncbi:MAG: hypothetical protein LBV34_20970, partial [Nocardiopsaceae bacterium]|nr:hypothetical protein [Nocardiopsaceae bacterium]